MYHSHKATIRHDKVFALLGMCCDDLEAVGLLPHYEIPWEVLFRRIIRHVLSQSVSIETWPDKELALIKGMGYSLGRVSAAYGDKSRFDRQHVHIDLNNSMQSLQYTKNPRSRCNHSIKPGTVTWTVRVSAQPVKPGDVVCLLQGASKPSIVRPFDDYFDIIIIGVTPLYIANGETFQPDESLTSDNPDPLDEMGRGLRCDSLRELLLVWNWDRSSDHLNQGEAVTTPSINDLVPGVLKTESDQAKRVYDVAAMLLRSIEGTPESNWRK